MGEAQRPREQSSRDNVTDEEVGVGRGGTLQGPVRWASEPWAYSGDERLLWGFQQKLDMIGDRNKADI